VENDATVVQKPAMTRDKLPEISQPLEILSDDISPKAAPAPETAPAAASQPEPTLEPLHEPATPAPSATPPRRAASTSQPEAGRAAARKVFEAKFKEPNPRLPFYITMGCLGAFAAGTVIWFWMQWPRPPSYVSNPARPQGEVQVAIPESKLAAAATAPTEG